MTPIASVDTNNVTPGRHLQRLRLSSLQLYIVSNSTFAAGSTTFYIFYNCLQVYNVIFHIVYDVYNFYNKITTTTVYNCTTSYNLGSM